jgi:Family of unknown function (DUF5906)/Bifunctional DNA primase/polymerase, N-terminal
MTEKQTSKTRGRKVPAELAKAYAARGWMPVPIPHGMKGPREGDWQNLSLDERLARFNGSPQNIGVQLGPISKNLTDIDLDCIEAVKLARHWLPPTKAVFGRASKRSSHYLYIGTGPVPEEKGAIRLQDDKSETIIELRLGAGGKGAQTMFPGSLHPNGEHVEWDQSGDPGEHAYATLYAAITKVAVGAMVLRHWPDKKGRHEAALRIAGLLARAGWEVETIVDFVETIAHEAQDEEVADRVKAAKDAVEEFARGGRTFGLPALIEWFTEPVANAIAKLLRYRESDHDDLLEQMNQSYCVLQVSGKMRILGFEEERGRLVPIFFSREDFKGLLDNKKVSAGKKKVGKASWWLDHTDRRQYDGLSFMPGQPAVVNNRLNLWRGWGVTPKPGRWPLLRSHIENVLSGGVADMGRYIIKWTAWSLQHPDKRPEVALVFRGGRGTGKGVYGRTLKDIFGQHGLHITAAEQWLGRFNAPLMDCALLFVDEAWWAGNKDAEGRAKAYITEPTIMIEKKGVDPIEVQNNLHIIIATNAEWVVPAGLDERRFAVSNVSEEYKQSKEYFVPLYEEIKNGGAAAMMHDLLALDLEGWHPRDDVPKTKALLEQKDYSLSPEQQWWFSMLKSGELPGAVDKHNPRLAMSEALCECARKTSPRLQFHSYHRLTEVLKQYGCDRDVNHRINGQRAWRFPPLAEARAAWDKLRGGAVAWEPTEGGEWEHPDAVM